MSQTRKQPQGAYVPETPAGTPLVHLRAKTEEQAWANLLRDAAHMPYRGIAGFKARGYRVERWSTEK